VPVDPLTGWSTAGTIPRTLQANRVGVPSIPTIQGYAFASPNSGTEVQYARDSATRIASHLPLDQPHLAFVNASSQAALATLDRVAQVGTYAASVTYPNNGFGQALRMIAGAMVKGSAPAMLNTPRSLATVSSSGSTCVTRARSTAT